MLTFSINESTEKVMEQVGKMNCKVNTGLGREWLSEAYLNALDGRVDDAVNVEAYGFACEQNTKMIKAKREVNLITVDEASTGVKGIADVVASVESNLEEVDARLDYANTIAYIQKWRWVVIDNNHYDFMLEIQNLIQATEIEKVKEGRLLNKLRYIAERYELEDIYDNLIKNWDTLNRYSLKLYGKTLIDTVVPKKRKKRVTFSNTKSENESDNTSEDFLMKHESVGKN